MGHAAEALWDAGVSQLLWERYWLGAHIVGIDSGLAAVGNRYLLLCTSVREALSFAGSGTRALLANLTHMLSQSSVPRVHMPCRHDSADGRSAVSSG